METYWKIISAAFLLISCTQEKTAYDSLEYGVEHDIPCVLSSVCDNIECIPLETTDECFLRGNAYIVHADEETLLLKSGDYIYNFASDGKFISRIGAVGNGPGEYSRLISVSVMPDSSRLLLYIGQNRVQIWRYSGEFMKQIRLSDSLRMTTAIYHDGMIISESRAYTSSGTNISLNYFDLEGNLQNRKIIYKTEYEENVSLQTFPIFYSYNDTLHYKFGWESDIYGIMSTAFDTLKQVSFGKYDPRKEEVENMQLREKSHKVNVVDVRESQRYSFILAVYSQSLRAIIYDKSLNNICCAQTIDRPQIGGGIENDQIKGTNFWPHYIDKNEIMYGLLPAGELDREQIMQIEHMTNSQEKVSQESNPIVIKTTAKTKGVSI